MKRTALVRRTPLVNRTPMAAHSTLRRTGHIAPVSAKRAAQAHARRTAETALGRVGTEGICARCGRYGYVNGHEKLGRSQGGDPTRPDCLLCVPCNTWCEDEPRAAAEQGWKISRKWDAA